MRSILIPLLVLGFAGCSTVKYAPTLQFSVTPSVSVEETTSNGKILAVRSLDAARPYRANIVVRPEPNVIDSIPQRDWAEWPRDVVTRTLFDAIVATHRFKDVGLASNLELPDYILTGEVRTFDLLQYESPWVAECSVRLEIRAFRSGDALMAKTISKRVPLESNEIGALPEAMSEAVKQVVEEAATEIRALP